MSLVERFSAHLTDLELSAARVLVAVSGGPDSVALLDLLVRSQDSHGFELVVAHLDHGIDPASSEVAGRVRSLAAQHGLKFEAREVNLGATATETLARERRYAWLEETRARTRSDFIFTAHHADDQVETVLMRVLAGSGPAGLAGMAARQGRVVRPLLPFHRHELEGHLSSAGLSAWIDPANSDPRHLRSWIRAELLPRVRSRVPQVEANLSRLAAQAGVNRAAWDAVLDLLPELDLRHEGQAISVAATPLGNYDSALTQATILALARRAGFPLGPSRARRVLRLLGGGCSGDQVPLGEQWTAELAFGRLRLYRLDAAASLPLPQSLEGHAGSANWGRWRFRWEPAIAPERQERAGLSAWFVPDSLTVRPWGPGDKVRPLGGSGRRLLVRCFQEARVPRSSRGAWPVFSGQEGILWVPGVCRADARIPPGGMEALRVDAQYA
jgi:tRNA(Ile)-lysidine synthase